MAYPEPMTDIRQRIDQLVEAEWAKKREIDVHALATLAAREMAILIRERLEERYNAHRRTNPSHSYDLGWGDGIDASAQYIDDLLASLVSAETPQVQDEKAFARCDQSGRSTADPRVDPSGGSWQPIKTAPKPGIPILVWVPRKHTIYAVIHEDESGLWRVLHPSAPTLGECPTHWMPLPSPPETPE